MKDSMFRYADGLDKLLMFFGTLGSLGDGLQNPLMMYILSDVINSYGSSNGSLTDDDVDKVTISNICLFFFFIRVGIFELRSLNKKRVACFATTY